MNPPRGPSIGGPIPGAYGPGGMRGPPPGMNHAIFFDKNGVQMSLALQRRTLDLHRYMSHLLNTFCIASDAWFIVAILVFSTRGYVAMIKSNKCQSYQTKITYK